MARTICIKPCPPYQTLPQLQIPFMGTAIKAQGDLSIKGGCDGCELIGNFLIQLNPLVSALGLPLCLLGCIGALVGFVTIVPDSLGPPPDPTVLVQKVVDVVKKCKCVVAMVLPPPVGPICDFLKMVRDIINMFATIIDCLVGLVTHLASFSLKAAICLASPNPAMKATGDCLVDQGQGMTDLLGSKLGPLGTLVNLLEPIFALLAAIVPPPFNDTIQDFKDGFAIFSGSIGTGTAPADFLVALNDFNDVIQTVAQTFTTIVSICP